LNKSKVGWHKLKEAMATISFKDWGNYVSTRFSFKREIQVPTKG
jgi:hypothetical protein